jgi:hypothetical protein
MMVPILIVKKICGPRWFSYSWIDTISNISISPHRQYYYFTNNLISLDPPCMIAVHSF